VQPERSLSYAPLCQVMLALQNVPAGAVKLAGVQAWALEAETIGRMARWNDTATAYS
jgi:hypothetical protein